MVLPIDTILGNLTMMTVYDYYDCPRLFSCKSEEGKLYIGMSIEDRDKEKCQLWFYALVSQRRLNDIEANKVELYDVFKNAEEHFVFGVKTCVDKDTTEMIVCDDIPDMFLPSPGVMLNVDEGKL